MYYQGRSMNEARIAKELLSVAKELTAKTITSRLMSRQQKLLDKWLGTSQGERAISMGHISYDDLPNNLISALERVKDQETLWSDVERYLDDKAMKMRYGSTKTARDEPMLDAIAKANKKNTMGLPMLRKHRSYQEAMGDLISAAMEVDEILKAAWLREYEQNAG
jgi:hypothetical protein